MQQRDFKLANVLLDVPDHLLDHPELLYRASNATVKDNELTTAEPMDFLTYFNALSAAKWHQYASIDEAFLELEVDGACTIQLTSVPVGAVEASDAPDTVAERTVSGVARVVEPEPLGEPVVVPAKRGFSTIRVAVPTDAVTSSILIGFELCPEGSVTIRRAWWGTRVAEDRVRPVRLAVATTTFRKEDYILGNIEKVRREVLASDDAIADGFHMYVVDNGKTLDAAALTHDGVTVLPNGNVGGSGGFARGMLAALDGEDMPDGAEPFTHVLLMDDDVVVSPESFKRTYNLLSLVNDRYLGAFINGAMLKMHEPHVQFEDVSYVLKSGAYRRTKPDLVMDSVADVAVNEVIDVEVPRTYGAWWYDCIPVSAVREQGLPLPLFVRCDDVEYGMRCLPTYMTMNGICVWHEAFRDRYRAPVDGYQYIRNFMVMNAVDDVSDPTLFMARTDRVVRLFLRTMAYDTADLLVSAVEDYLKGPRFLMSESGSAILKGNGAKAEKLVPLAEAIEAAEADHPELAESLDGFVPDERVYNPTITGPMHRVMSLVRTLPYDKHLLPEGVLSDKPATAFYGGVTVPAPEQTATRVIVACDAEGQNAHVRVMDKERWQGIHDRWAAAKERYRVDGEAVRREYREAMGEMTSPEFWRAYLEERFED